jgi:hypothetical protein
VLVVEPNAAIDEHVKEFKTAAVVAFTKGDFDTSEQLFVQAMDTVRLYYGDSAPELAPLQNSLDMVRKRNARKS